MRQMKARYAGTCTRCKNRFDKGTDILWAPNRAAHVTCPKVEAAEPPEVDPSTVPYNDDLELELRLENQYEERTEREDEILAERRYSYGAY